MPDAAFLERLRKLPRLPGAPGPTPDDRSGIDWLREEGAEEAAMRVDAAYVWAYVPLGTADTYVAAGIAVCSEQKDLVLAELAKLRRPTPKLAIFPPPRTRQR